MSYTTVDLVAAMFPMLVRNGPRGPSDALIQTFIDDVAADIDAVLERRFQEAYQAVGFAAWQAAFNAQQVNVLEHLNRWGACAQLADVFEANGVTVAVKLAQTYEQKFQSGFRTLNSRDANDKPLTQGGDYDYLFDSQAKVETPRSILKGNSGRPQPGDEEHIGWDDPPRYR